MMKQFISKTFVFLIIIFAILELLCRIIIDPLYFYSIDTYNLRFIPGIGIHKLSNIYLMDETPHVDYLFIGTSRVPATINPHVFMEQDPGSVAVVAGRGFVTAGVHLQALKRRVTDYPDYLRGATVFIEYPGTRFYEDPLRDEEFNVFEPIVSMDKTMPHLLLPHLNIKSLYEYLRKSPNDWSVKIEMFCLYFSSWYRSVAFIKENFNRLDQPLMQSSAAMVADEGGVRNDHFQLARDKAILVANKLIKKSKLSAPLTMKAMDNSVLASIAKLIHDHGGRLVMYKMPLHSILEAIYSSKKEMQNKAVFENWLNMNNIYIVHVDNFIYRDIDFPDVWHLSKERRDEFSLKLYRAYMKHL